MNAALRRTAQAMRGRKATKLQAQWSGFGDEGCLDGIMVNGSGGAAVEDAEDLHGATTEALFAIMKACPEASGLEDGDGGWAAFSLSLKKNAIAWELELHRNEETARLAMAAQRPLPNDENTEMLLDAARQAARSRSIDDFTHIRAKWIGSGDEGAVDDLGIVNRNDPDPNKQTIYNVHNPNDALLHSANIMMDTLLREQPATQGLENDLGGSAEFVVDVRNKTLEFKAFDKRLASRSILKASGDVRLPKAPPSLAPRA